jgi:multimeric flavodoxin WrbA
MLARDIMILATPLRWNNHFARVQKFVERMNCIENQFSWFGNRMITNKVAALIIIGHVDGIQHVSGNLLNFVSLLGFHTPEVAIASGVGENDEDSPKDRGLIGNNKYTKGRPAQYGQQHALAFLRSQESPFRRDRRCMMVHNIIINTIGF